MSEITLTPAQMAAVEIQGVTRSAFILKGALAAGAVYGAGVVGPFVNQALAQGGGDIAILNFALTLEHLEANFYKDALSKAGLSGDVKSLAEEIGANEQEHVTALTSTIKNMGGKPDPAPKTSFPLKDEKSFLKLAVVLEDTGVSAYNGAAPSIKALAVLAAAGGIVQVEARHAAAIRLVAGEDPSPDAFDKTLEMDEVLKAVKPFVSA